jgi:hypothetical protein
MKTQRFGNWICFRPQVRRETPTLLWRVGTQHGRRPSPHLSTETDPVSKTLFSSYLECWTMDKAQKPSNSECYTPSSESFSFCQECYFYLTYEGEESPGVADYWQRFRPGNLAVWTHALLHFILQGRYWGRAALYWGTSAGSRSPTPAGQASPDSHTASPAP